MYCTYQYPNKPSLVVNSWKVYADGSSDFKWTGGKIVKRELINILCNDYTACDDADDDDDDNEFATKADTN